MSFSWQTSSAAEQAPSALGIGENAWSRLRARLAALRGPRPEMAALIVLAGVLNLWALSRNGWANDYYSAAVRSMSTSWHNFLFASLDPSGVMTVDKPPLALWVQALSVRLFGYHSLSILVPQALMGIAAVALVYDLVRRRFGRVGGFVAGLALAVTPITVAVSRHNNPDALLVLCSVAALWCAIRALEAPPRRQTRWLALAGVCVGLGFETKMGVALTVVPGIAAAWLWIAPAARGRLHALRQLLVAGGAMVVVGGAWPALVELTPASQRPWVSGTSDNRVLSLIFEYNGLGRVDGQAGGPGGFGGSMFGGSAGPLRLLNSALGGQAGWLLGFAAVSGLGLLALTRLRRRDERTGWLIAVGGAFAVTAVLFSFASGIFHPYYVSLLAPFVAALVGAGVAQLLRGGLYARIVGPLAVAAGVAAELAVLGDYVGQLRWLVPVLLAAGCLTALALALVPDRRVRAVAVTAALAVLLVAPTAWAFETLGHAASSTFPEGGPGNVQATGGAGGRGFPGPRGFGAFGGGTAGGQRLFGTGAAGARGEGGPTGAGAPAGFAGPGGGEGPPSGEGGRPPQAGGFGGLGFGSAAAGRTGGFPGAGARAGGPGGFGGDVSSAVLAYVRSHGGGTIAVSSQSSAASAIISRDADVAGIGGFSGRESDVSVSWLAQEVAAGRIRWVLDQETAGGLGSRGLRGDARPGSKKALSAVSRACRRVTVSEGAASASAGTSAAGSSTLYDCRGRAAELA